MYDLFKTGMNAIFATIVFRAKNLELESLLTISLTHYMNNGVNS